VQQQSAATAPDGIDVIRPVQTSDLLRRPRLTTMRLVRIEGSVRVDHAHRRRKLLPRVA
jgi:hypothetical protein